MRSRIVAMAMLGLVLTFSAPIVEAKGKPKAVPAQKVIDVTVAANTKSGIYHYSGCRWYNGKNVTEMKESAAKKNGYRACKVCGR